MPETGGKYYLSTAEGPESFRPRGTVPPYIQSSAWRDVLDVVATKPPPPLGRPTAVAQYLRRPRRTRWSVGTPGVLGDGSLTLRPVALQRYAMFGDDCRIRNGVVGDLRQVDDACAPRISNSVDIGVGA